MTSVTVRDFRPADAEDLYDVCLRTGDSGGDATALLSVPRLLGDVFVGPYLELAPELALVADDGARAAGYALGVVDTSEFDALLDARWWPRVQSRYADADPPADPMTAELLAMVAQPALVRHPDLPGYPSHLHIDLLEHVRGSGVGTAMLQELFSRLSSAGSPGVHLGVATSNVGAQRFYRRLGFTDLLHRGEELFMGLSWDV